MYIYMCMQVIKYKGSAPVNTVLLSPRTHPLPRSCPCPFPSRPLTIAPFLCIALTGLSLSLSSLNCASVHTRARAHTRTHEHTRAHTQTHTRARAHTHTNTRTLTHKHSFFCVNTTLTKSCTTCERVTSDITEHVM